MDRWLRLTIASANWDNDRLRLLSPRITARSRTWARKNYLGRQLRTIGGRKLGEIVKTDVMDPRQRYLAMSHNRGRTCPERALASALWRRGLRYFTHAGYARISGKRLLGKPDLVFPRKKIAIFVDGCFWHGCPHCGKSPERSGRFWVDKIANNRERDQRVTANLENDGWTVLRVPEHEVRSRGVLSQTVERLIPLLMWNP